jgi:subtilisin family serine protease
MKAGRIMSILPNEFGSEGPVPGVLVGYLSLRSQGGRSALDVETRQVTNAEAFHGSSDDRDEAARIANSVGLEIIAESALGIAVTGTPGAFEELTGGEVVTRERLMHAEMGRERYVTHLDIVGDNQPDALGVGAPRPEASAIEGVVLERPRLPYGIFPSPVPPPVTKFHLRVPDDVALVLGALAAHRAGDLGAGATVAMVDTGQYAHPFFLAHGYDVQPTVALVPGTNPARDPVGHGTGESANIFATAPRATLRPYRASDSEGRLVAALAGFLRAKTDRPAVLTNSWGGDGEFPPPGPPDAADRLFALEITDAIEQGITVVFSGGNGQFSIEPQVPGVLAAGGVFAGPTLDLSASTYASGYASSWFDDVTVPTVCGLVGMVPRAQYLMLPVPPGCEIDVDESQTVVGDPPDGTTSRDGWALFSGTSAAAPQLAGVAALLLGALPNLTPAQVVKAMTSTAVDVRAGRCHVRFNEPAASGPDLATGQGLVNASAALAFARANFGTQ